MVAVGFVLLIVGFVLYLVWELEHVGLDHWKSNVAYGMTVVGIFLMLAGVAIWLWRVMP